MQSRVLSRLFYWPHIGDPLPLINCGDVLETTFPSNVDLIVTDPPYYDAIPYADTSDFFFLWNKRNGFIPETLDSQTADSVVPKQEELIQHTARFGGSEDKAKAYYTHGMTRAFEKAHYALSDDALIVIVFAHKEPDAWETLLEAIIGAGFIVTASWPIDTEKANRVRGMNSAALATSLWLVCRKRPARVREWVITPKSSLRCRDGLPNACGISGTRGFRDLTSFGRQSGPALESYSSYKEVRRNTGEPFTVSEFLTEVRRTVTDFALGQILHGASTEALDEWTRYYLMHMNHFGTRDAPVGECILLAQGYGLSLDDLTAARIGILKKASSGSALRLLGHTDRNSDRVGQPHTSGELPIIDMLHRVMNLWDAGDKTEINAYLIEHGLRENTLFKSIIQALIETNPQGSNERSLLETLINYDPGQSASSDDSGQSASGAEKQLTLKFEGVSS